MKVLWVGRMSGSVLFFDKSNFPGYQNWEEFERTREHHLASTR